MADLGLIFERGRAAVGTDVEGDWDDMVGVFHRLKGVAGVPRLTARLSARGDSEALGRGLGIAVGRRGLAAVVAILSEPSFQRINTLLQDADLFLQRQNNIDENLGVIA